MARQSWKGSSGLELTHNISKYHQVLPWRDSMTSLCFPIFFVAVCIIHLKQCSNEYRILCPMLKAILYKKKKGGREG